jgi:hypothetical protein
MSVLFVEMHTKLHACVMDDTSVKRQTGFAWGLGQIEIPNIYPWHAPVPLGLLFAVRKVYE